ncbi:hypothetical protein GCM10023149_14340 [Mucilaginibacter gynuensis]|uniref:Uncharacterized protein n=1 Tax=Mucilaginibacter gynuensis TaxID=1302236 RepID=A0ABP8G3Y3_9SPHI
MKKIFILLVIIAAWSNQLLAQGTPIDTTINLDVLKSPASPAFNMLGLSPSDVERPTDVNAFALSLQNSTKNFTTLPNSYAVEIAPVYIVKKSLISLDKFNSTKFGDVFLQSLVLSIGYTHVGPEGMEDVDSLRQSKMGIGIRFAIVRPKFSAKTSQTYNDLIAQQKVLLKDYLKIKGENPDAKELQLTKDSIKALFTTPMDAEKRKSELERLNLKRAALVESINEAGNTLLADREAFNTVKKIASDFKIERTGAFLDFSAGMVLDFPYDRFSNSTVSKAGAWLTGGYEGGNNGLSIMGINRFLFQPDKVFADDNNVLATKNISTYDAGLRLLYNGLAGRFVLSTEAIYRSVISKSTIDPSWRLVFNTEYDIGTNKKITFAFGRNFDGTTTKGGNLVAALNFISSFGSARKISN